MMFLIFLLNISIFTRIIECHLRVSLEKTNYDQKIIMRLHFSGQITSSFMPRILKLYTQSCSLKVFATDHRSCKLDRYVGHYVYVPYRNHIVVQNTYDFYLVPKREYKYTLRFDIISNIKFQHFKVYIVDTNTLGGITVNTEITIPVEFDDIPKITRNSDTFDPKIDSSCFNFRVYNNYNGYELRFKVRGYPIPRLFSNLTETQVGLSAIESWDSNRQRGILDVKILLKEKIRNMGLRAEYYFRKYTKRNNKQICINIEYKDMQLEITTPKKYYSLGDGAVFTITFNSIPGLSQSPMKLVRVNCLIHENLEVKKEDCQNKVGIATINENTLYINNTHYKNEYRITPVFKKELITLTFNKLTLKDSFFYVEMVIPNYSTNYEYSNLINTWITAKLTIVNLPKIRYLSDTIESESKAGSSCFIFKVYKESKKYEITFKISGYPTPKLKIESTSIALENGLEIYESVDLNSPKTNVQAKLILIENVEEIIIKASYDYPTYNKNNDKTICINIDYSDLQLAMKTSKLYYSRGDEAKFTITFNVIPGISKLPMKLIRANCLLNESIISNKVKKEDCQNRIEVATLFENNMVLNANADNGHYSNNDFRIRSVFNDGEIKLIFNKLTIDDSFFYVEMKIPDPYNYEYSNYVMTGITVPVEFITSPKITYNSDAFKSVTKLDNSCLNFILYKKYNEYELIFKISGYPTPKLKIESTSIALQNGIEISKESWDANHKKVNVLAKLILKQKVTSIIIKASYDYRQYNKNNDKTICINIEYKDIQLIITPSKSYYLNGDNAIFTITHNLMPGLSQLPMKLIRANCLLNESVKVKREDCQNKIEVGTIYENEFILNANADNGHYLNSDFRIISVFNKGEIKLNFNQLTIKDSFFYVEMNLPTHSQKYVYSNYVNTKITVPVEVVTSPKITCYSDTFDPKIDSSCFNFKVFKIYNEYELTFKISGYPTPKLKIESSSIALQNELEISKESLEENHKKVNVLARLILKQKVTSIIIKASYDYPQYNKENDKTICINIEYIDIKLIMTTPRKYYLSGDEAIFTIILNTIPGFSKLPMKLVRANCLLDEVLEYKKKDCQNKVELATIRDNSLNINMLVDNGHYATNENKITADFNGNEIKIKFNKLTKKDSFIYVEMAIPSNSDNYVHSNYINTRITESISNVTMDVYRGSSIIDPLVSISECKEYGVQVDSKVKVTCQGDGNQYPVIDMTMTNYKVKPGEIITKKVRIGRGIFRTVKSFSFILSNIKISCKYKYAYAEYNIKSDAKPTCVVLKIEGFSSVSTILSGLFIGLVVFGILLFIMCNPLTKYIEKTFGIKLFKGKTKKGQKEDKMANKKLIQNYGAMPGGVMPGGVMPGVNQIGGKMPEGKMPEGKDKKDKSKKGKGKKDKSKKGKDKKDKSKKGKDKKDKSKKKSKKNKKGKIAVDTQANKDDKTSNKGDITSNTGTIAVDTKSNKGKPSDDKNSNKGDLISNKDSVNALSDIISNKGKKKDKKKGKKGDKSKKRSKKNKKGKKGGKKGDKSRKRSKKHKKGKIADDTQSNKGKPSDDKKSNKGDKKSYKDEPYADDKTSNKGDKKSYKDEPYADEPYADEPYADEPYAAKSKKGKKKNKKGKPENDMQSNNDNQFEEAFDQY